MKGCCCFSLCWPPCSSTSHLPTYISPPKGLSALNSVWPLDSVEGLIAVTRNSTPSPIITPACTLLPPHCIVDTPAASTPHSRSGSHATSAVCLLTLRRRLASKLACSHACLHQEMTVLLPNGASTLPDQYSRSNATLYIIRLHVLRSTRSLAYGSCPSSHWPWPSPPGMQKGDAAPPQDGSHPQVSPA